MEICRVLKVCTIPERQPILFHCKSGKDRTGVITLFLLTSVGCSREEIIADYTRSHSFVCSNRHYELTGQLPYRSLSKNDRDFFSTRPNLRCYMPTLMHKESDIDWHVRPGGTQLLINNMEAFLNI